MKNRVTRIVRSVVEWIRPARRVQPEPRITPEQLREALAAMLAEPRNRKLATSLAGILFPISGGQVTCDIEANRIKSGTFGASGCQGNYSFMNSNLGIGTTTPQEALHVNGGVGIGKLAGADTEGLEISYMDGGGGTVHLTTQRHTGIYVWRTQSPTGIKDLMQLWGDPANNHLNLFNPASGTPTVPTVQFHSIGSSFFNAGNVGIGTTNPSEKLDVVGKIKSDGLNKIVFLRPTGVNDGTRINDEIQLLPPEGGIIKLMPGPPDWAIEITVTNVRGSVAKNGVKLRGYGGAFPDGTFGNPVTKLRWTGPAGGTVIEFKPVDPDPTTLRSNQVQDFELSDLTIDGAGVQGSSVGAGIGINLDRVINSRFRNVNVRDMKDQGGIGIKLTTTAFTNVADPPPSNPAVDKGSHWNLFENCSVFRASKCILVTGESADGSTPTPKSIANSAHNTFIGLCLKYRGTRTDDAGIHLGECDNNGFFQTFIFRLGTAGNGVLVEDPNKARANWFYQLQPSAGGFLIQNTATLTVSKNIVFGYSHENNEPIPMSTPDPEVTKFLFWVDSNGGIGGAPVLAKQQQETGYCSAGGLAAVDAQPGSAWSVEAPVNFKTVMFQEPTALDVTVIGAFNIQAVAIKYSDGSQSTAWTGPFTGTHRFEDPGKKVSRFGFTLIVSSAIGLGRGTEYTFQANYKTVGN